LDHGGLASGDLRSFRQSNDALHFALERSQREGLNHEDRITRGLRQRLRAHEHELAPQFRPEPGKVIVSCSLPMNADDTELVIAHTTSGAEALAKKVPKARVVSAFNTVPSEVLFGVFEARRKATKPSLVYCGDDASSKKIAAELIHDVGFEPVDAGPLRIARYTEPFALLVAQLAYEGDEGPELAYRFERFRRKA
jgi:predicted dinucleotide-binding enzyme